MRRTGFIIAGCFLLFQCQIIKAQQKNDWERENLKGRVQKLRELSYSVIDEKGEINKGDWIRTIVSEFNDKGHFIVIYDDPIGIAESESNFIYDTNGFLLEKNRFSGRIGFMSRYICKNDSLGNLIEQNSYNFNDSLLSKIKYKYDNLGNRVEVSQYSSFKNYYEISTFKYDSLGYLIEQNYINWHSKHDRIFTFKNDCNGNIIETNTFKKGKLIKVVFSKYIFDNNGNWIQRIDFSNDKPFQITERQITYY